MSNMLDDVGRLVYVASACSLYKIGVSGRCCMSCVGVAKEVAEAEGECRDTDY